MESAIPGHLQTARTRHRRVRDDYAPPYPSFVARHKPGVTRVVMAYFGLQFRGDTAGRRGTGISAARCRFHRAGCPNALGPRELCRRGRFHQRRHGGVLGRPANIRRAGFRPPASAGPVSSASTTGSGPSSRRFTRPIERYETLFSSLGRPEGVAVLADGMSGEVLEHAYWGGMRDRIPLSQTSEMAPSGAARAIRDGARIRIVPHDNLCLIRSGQDWGDTEAAERKMYLGDVEPVLREGMDFLRDQGRSIGCYANRYMTVAGPDGATTEKSYGMSWWKSLSALERWAESHPTHVKIFGAAMKYLSTLGPAAKLRLYHEVTVARADEQLFEYVDCHPQTGMLNAVQTVEAA